MPTTPKVHYLETMDKTTCGLDRYTVHVAYFYWKTWGKKRCQHCLKKRK